ncbi:GtrA family protein [Paenibacillus apiarius]|uniref:GtrA family protein n=1 Tax=Paenibacillus apiarius TaxID=46240 RepID=UPI003B3A14E1
MMPVSLKLARLFSRYALVGVINTFVGLGLIYVLMHAAGWDHFASTFTGNTAGVLCSYVLNRFYTFRYEGAMLRSFVRFAAISMLCYGFAYMLLHPFIANTIEGAAPFLAAVWRDSAVVLAESGVYTAASFLLHRYVTFADKRSLPAASSPLEPHAADDYGKQRNAEH